LLFELRLFRDGFKNETVRRLTSAFGRAGNASLYAINVAQLCYPANSSIGMRRD
jgi:hypothetical protein